ncbi:MAG: DUF1203 domain-containing protein [Steroidobacteraceae bacterium]|jgi:hypothetical protein
MAFRISGLSPAPFRPLYGLSDEELAQKGIRRYIADTCPGFPDRIEMRDAGIGQSVLLLNHVCQPADTPFRASHAIFVREGAETTYVGLDEVPEVMRTRVLSLRAFDGCGMMLDADLADGGKIEALIARLFGNPRVHYIHAHYAKRGCYSGRIDRA